MATRIDHKGHFRTEYQKNRRTILMTQDICAICGRVVDKGIPTSEPMGATVDHIVPINKGGHPSDITNLQLAHRICNRLKSDKMYADTTTYREAVRKEKNKIFQTRDWKKF